MECAASACEKIFSGNFWEVGLFHRRLKWSECEPHRPAVIRWKLNQNQKKTTLPPPSTTTQRRKDAFQCQWSAIVGNSILGKIEIEIEIDFLNQRSKKWPCLVHYRIKFIKVLHIVRTRSKQIVQSGTIVFSANFSLRFDYLLCARTNPIHFISTPNDECANEHFFGDLNLSIHQWHFEFPLDSVHNAQTISQLTLEKVKWKKYCRQIIWVERHTKQRKMHRICAIPKQSPTINKMELGSQMVALRRSFLCFANGRKSFDKKKKKNTKGSKQQLHGISPFIPWQQAATGTLNWIARIGWCVANCFELDYRNHRPEWVSEHWTIVASLSKPPAPKIDPKFKWKPKKKQKLSDACNLCVILISISRHLFTAFDGTRSREYLYWNKCDECVNDIVI